MYAIKKYSTVLGRQNCLSQLPDYSLVGSNEIVEIGLRRRGTCQKIALPSTCEEVNISRMMLNNAFCEAIASNVDIRTVIPALS